MIDLVLNRIVSFLLACFLLTGQAFAFTRIDQCCCRSQAPVMGDSTSEEASQQGDHLKVTEHHCNDQAQEQTKDSKKSCCNGQQVLTCCCGSQTLGFRVDATLLEIPQATVMALVHHSVSPHFGEVSMVSLWDKSPATPPPRA